MVTIRQIAERCGVSTATVSKALNHATDIGEETANRIRQTARDLGYTPNAAARSLKTRHTHNLGIVSRLRTNDRSHDFIAQIISALQGYAEDGGYDVTLVSSQIKGMATNYLDHCRYRNFDGVAIVCADFTSPPVVELLHSDIPCVCVDCLGTGRGEVMTDSELSMRQLVEYAYEMGHRRIAFIHGEEFFYVTRVRMASFRKACAAKGLPLPEDYVQSALYNDYDTTRAATSRLLELPDPPTCILFPDDFAMMGGLSEIEARGLCVPQDISVIGYDGFSFSQVTRPKLTTYRQDVERIASECVRMLRESIESPRAYVPRQVLVPGQLQTGGTVSRLQP